ncbi:MAG: membrane dipeptidase, partial [Gammaproteobacteria bacterium]|nr:membrane dipeptidase [Gammaproteobacteria bacterium]
LINYFHQWIQKNHNDYVIIMSAHQLSECLIKNKLGIAFDIEGCNLLNGKLEMVAKFYSLGVRQMIFAYNNNNISGGGCFDKDTGLTTFGKQLVHECNNIGMVIDCSHVGYQTSMEIIELSQYPIVFSHSNPKKMTDHPRNITDEQIITCAERGGVIGINGIGIFLGNNDVSTEKIVEHIDYVAQLVGAEHVGIGLDCIFDTEEAKKFADNNPKTFPVAYGFKDIAVAQPEQFSEISELLITRGYSENDINNILGENFFRIAKAIWK